MTHRFLGSLSVLLAAMAAVSETGWSAERESIRDLAARYGFTPAIPNPSNIVLSSGFTTLAFETSSRRLLLNGTLIWLNEQVQSNGHGWTLSRVDAARVIEPLLRPDRVLASTGMPVIVLDPGHGGNDDGASGRRVSEKRIVLDIARRTRTTLAGYGFPVHLTRDDDSALTLSERTDRARRWQGDIFVSIHLNSAQNTNACGIETYVLPATGYQSTMGEKGNTSQQPGNRFDLANSLLSYHVHRGVLEHSRSPDRGIKRARFDVLCTASCPAILVECGFLSNPYEGEMMSIKDYREAVAAGIAQGILSYAGSARTSK